MKTGSVVLHGIVAASLALALALALAGDACLGQTPQGRATSSAVSGGAAEKPAFRPQVIKHRLLSRPDIQSDLKLSPSQLQRIEALTQQIIDSRENMPPEAASTAEEDIGRMKLALLSEDQRLRLDQIIFWIGGTPMSNEEVREQLSLTADQQAKLKALDADAEAMRKRDGVDAFLKARPAQEKKMESLLTAQQRQRFERLVGRPFVDAGGGGICFQMPPGMAADGAAPPKLPQLENGKPVPDFTALDHDGKPVRLSDFKGKVVVIDLWATWCGPCIQALPGLEALHRQMKGQDVVVLALNVGDGKPAYEAWVKKNPRYTVPFLYDPAGADQPGIRAQYGVMGIPTTFVVDRHGNLVGKTVGSAGSTLVSSGNAPGWDGTPGEIDPRLAVLLNDAGVHLAAAGQ